MFIRLARGLPPIHKKSCYWSPVCNLRLFNIQEVGKWVSELCQILPLSQKWRESLEHCFPYFIVWEKCFTRIVHCNNFDWQVHYRSAIANCIETRLPVLLMEPNHSTITNLMNLSRQFYWQVLYHSTIANCNELDCQFYWLLLYHR